MKKILLGTALAITFCTPLSAQRLENSVFAAPTPAGGAPNATDGRMGAAPTHFSARTTSIALAEAERASGGKKLFYGGLIGAAMGAVGGTYMMYAADEWMAPPAHIFTVPVGAVVGVLVGAVIP
jgi:hypothetical protein